ncbi:MAG: hypothetical protein WCI87_05585 [Euryarchaeota archaeon]
MTTFLRSIGFLTEQSRGQQQGPGIGGRRGAVGELYKNESGGQKRMATREGNGRFVRLWRIAREHAS